MIFQRLANLWAAVYHETMTTAYSYRFQFTFTGDFYFRSTGAGGFV